MKKFISSVLVIIMILCSFPLSLANAEEFNLTIGSETVCNYNGETLVYTFTPTEQIEAVLYSKTDDEETDPSMEIYCNGEYVGFCDDEGVGYNFFYYGEFLKGNTYTFEINDYYGTSGNWVLVFRERTVESLEILNIPELYTDIYGNADFVYEGITVKINYIDPSLPSKAVTFTENDSETEVDGLPLCVDYYPEDSAVIAFYEGVTAEAEITVNQKPIKSFELFIPEKSRILYEDIDCVKTSFYDEEMSEYVETYVYSPVFANAAATITYEDDAVQTVTYNDDPLFFLMLENDLDSQFKTPWEVGLHPVTFTYQGFSETVTFELKKNPYVSAEITKAPDVTESLFEGIGYLSYDSDYNTYFHYDTSLSGISVLLKDEAGNETVISDELAVALKLKANTNQESEHWGIGDHSVEVYYGRMLAGSYTFTVSDVTLTDIDIVTKAEGAYYYEDSGDTAFLEDGLSVKLTLSNGSSENVNVEDFQKSNVGVTLNVYTDYDNEAENYFYTICNNTYSVAAEAVYFKKLSRSVTSLEIVTPPAKMTYVYDYGIDVYSLDLSNLTVDIYWSDGSVDTWTYSSDFEDGIGVFNNTVISLYIANNYMTCSAGDQYTTYYSEDYKNIKEYSLGTIKKNTEMTIDLGLPQITVYTFTPWDNGTYYFTSEGEKYSVIALYDENGTLLPEYITTDHILNGSTKAELSFDCVEGETYYVLLETFDLFQSEDDTTVDFTVDHTVFGDANGDGKVSIGDVLLVRKYIAGLIDEDSVNIDAADVNGDGRLTIGDVLFIRKYIAGLIDSFPVAT